MSALTSLLDRVQRAYAKVSELEAVAARFPGDEAIITNIASVRRDAEKLERRWEAESLSAQMEVCRYRIMPQHVEQYGVRHVGHSLVSFQDFFSQIYDAVVAGKKARKRLTAEVEAMTALNVGFIYPGSLGVAMTVPADRDLFTNRYDQIVDDVLNVMKLHTENDVRKIAESYGVAVVKRLFDWSKVNSVSGYSIGLTWNSRDGRQKSRIVDAADFSRNVDLISRVSEASKVTVSPIGMLLGIDRAVKSFRFVSDDDRMFSGRLGEAFPLHIQWAINTRYIADIEEETVTRFATDETTTTYRLQKLTHIQLDQLA